MLTGKHRRGKPAPEGTRQFAGWSEPPICDEERLWNVIDVLVAVGDARGVSDGQVAPAWLLTRPAVSSLIAGGRNEAQFKDNFAVVDLKLTEAELTRLNEVSRPPLIYPHWHQGQFAAERFSPADHAMHDGNPPPKW